MNVDGLIAMPSFRPDGRLERLNHGGGSKLPKTIPGEPAKVQKYPDFFRMVHLMAYQKAQGIKKTDFEMGYHIPPGVGKPQKKPGGSAQGTGATQAQKQSSTGPSMAQVMQTQADAPAAMSAAATAGPKKRRTLLSGGGRSFSQPFGSDTILGG